MSASWLDEPWVLYPLALVGLAFVGYLDHVSGPELSFSLFYLAPVALVAVKGRKLPAVVLALSSAIVWGVVEMRGRSYSHVTIGYWNTGVRLGFFVIVASTLAQLTELVARERANALTDSLTGVGNSRVFYSVLEREVERMKRSGKPLAVAYMDVDDFKAVNDAAGHLAGDELLRRCAQVLSNSVRATDTVARLGGDEFGLVLPETNGPDARRMLERVRAALASRVGPRTVTYSIGAVVTAVPPDEVETLIRSADELMYRVKKTGKNALLLETRPPTSDSPLVDSSVAARG